jgi:hypothetical protein
MEILEFFNKLSLNYYQFDLYSLYKNEFVLQTLQTISIFLLNLVAYLYLFLKFYKVLCYSKMTFEWLPMINPYVWPFSVFQVLTTPYFLFWSKIFPSIRFETSSIEISGVIALESLNSLIYFCVRLTNFLVTFLQQLDALLIPLKLEYDNFD